ncbi:Na/Pi symporter [Lysinibacillus antri]|uniref:Na/Pi cotransporter family protein n=1 Tax=Lysinibacillus antri TaxID=2498145 RepID=A0A3S0R5Y7_9BACI|nr:Na/Pi symporter [Lysinibacillus antri]RUL51761.1 Na/Pi cotransporter family protein [Lysinibacillus antri]
MLQLSLFILMIGLFLLGMFLLRKGLFDLSSKKLEKSLVTLTNKPWKGLLLGIVVTSILQSSSAVSIITIGLVAAKVLTFSQSIGVILGANIGTTVTAELITLNIDSFILPIAIIGAILFLFKNKTMRNSGLALIGIAAIFGAMWGFEKLATPLRGLAYIDKILLMLDGNLFYAVVAGALIAAFIQSSTATTGIMMGFLAAGSMNLDTSVAIVLGANIGTCLDAWLASLGSGRQGKLTAYAHIWLNVLGVGIFYPFIGLLATIGTHLSKYPDVQLAHISVIFNVASSLMILPFTKQFANFIERVHGRK